MTTIKNIILFALMSLMVIGCTYKTEEPKQVDGFNIIIVDSCEYLKREEGNPHQGFGYMAHKGNCRFCKERRQKELEELVIKLKDK